MKTLSPDKRSTVGHRLAIIDGHLRKVRSMIDSGADCIDVIHQSRAIQQALKKFDERVLEDHLKSCVARDLKHNGLEKTTREILEAFQKI